MAKQLCYADPEKLTSMADSLRQKLGTIKTYTISEMDQSLKTVSFGVDTTDATAVASDIVAGVSAYANDEKIDGTLSEYLARLGTGNVWSSNFLSFDSIAENGDASNNGGVVARFRATNDFYIRTGSTIYGTFTAGTANTNEVLSGKTFTSVSGNNLTGTMPSKTAETFTPSTTDQTITSGQYLSGDQTIAGDPNLVSTNIKSGVSIFNVEGSLQTGATIYTTTTTPSSNSTTISFTGLAQEPKMFAVQIQSQITNSSTRTVVNVMSDGTNTYASQSYEQRSNSSGYTYYSTSFTWSYSNGTLTITSPSGTTTAGGYFRSGYAYRLICAY